MEFLLGDLRACRRPAGTLAAIFFTYDVYSFVPGRAARVALLREMARWLRPGGAVFVSARRFERAWDPLILTLQRAARRGGGEWGESHTRWIAPDGTLRRSFVRVFTDRAFRREARERGAAGRRMARQPLPAAPGRAILPLNGSARRAEPCENRVFGEMP